MSLPATERVHLKSFVLELEQTGAVGAQRAVPKRSPESQVQLKVAQRASRRRLHTAGQHAVFAAALFFFRLGSELK